MTNLEIRAKEEMTKVLNEKTKYADHVLNLESDIETIEESMEFICKKELDLQIEISKEEE